MTGARRPFAYLCLLGALLIVAMAGAGVYGHARVESMVAGRTPRLDGRPSVLRDALNLPERGFPTIPSIESEELDRLIPIDRPIRVGRVPPWLELPRHPQLGAAEARRRGPLRRALNEMYLLESSLGDRPADEAELDDRTVGLARTELARAEESMLSGHWIVYYNRGVLYRWQGNRQKAAVEFQRAAKILPPFREGLAEEVRSARIHVLYAWGESLIREGQGIPPAALQHLRQAAIESAAFARGSEKPGVAHAAEFFTLPPTGLLTSAIRNDLIASYLETPQHASCNRPFSLDVCGSRPRTGACQYRDVSFCAARDKAPDDIRELYEAELQKLSAGGTNEATAWALQNVAEVASENVALEREPELSYNIAHLLLRLRQPQLAYAYISKVTEADEQERVTAPMVRLAFVTSILAGETPTALSGPSRNAQTMSAMRKAYLNLYTEKDAPRPFAPLNLEDPRKIESLDAWLFIRLYRSYFERADFEGFVREYDRFIAQGVPPGILPQWRRQISVQYVKRAAARRDKAEADEVAAINRFLARRDLFSPDVFEEAGVDQPFEWTWMRKPGYALVVVLMLSGLAAYILLCRVFRLTFVSAYKVRPPGPPTTRMRPTV